MFLPGFGSLETVWKRQAEAEMLLDVVLHPGKSHEEFVCFEMKLAWSWH